MKKLHRIDLKTFEEDRVTIALAKARGQARSLTAVAERYFRLTQKLREFIDASMWDARRYQALRVGISSDPELLVIDLDDFKKMSVAERAKSFDEWADDMVKQQPSLVPQVEGAAPDDVIP